MISPSWLFSLLIMAALVNLSMGYALRVDKESEFEDLLGTKNVSWEFINAIRNMWPDGTVEVTIDLESYSPRDLKATKGSGLSSTSSSDRSFKHRRNDDDDLGSRSAKKASKPIPEEEDPIVSGPSTSQEQSEAEPVAKPVIPDDEETKPLPDEEETKPGTHDDDDTKSKPKPKLPPTKPKKPRTKPPQTSKDDN